MLLNWFGILLLAAIFLIGLTTGHGLIAALVAIPVYVVLRILVLSRYQNKKAIRQLKQLNK